MNNITLIGMPGAGKSSIGVVLAKVLGYQFIDSDLLIQKAEKRTLSEIIADEGTEGFKAIEESCECFDPGGEYGDRYRWEVWFTGDEGYAASEV